MIKNIEIKYIIKYFHKFHQLHCNQQKKNHFLYPEKNNLIILSIFYHFIKNNCIIFIKIIVLFLSK